MITFKEAIGLIRADYEPIARTVVRRLARATKRRPVNPIVIHAIARVVANRKTRKLINRKAA
jgi:predicted nucleic acid-binding protein